MPQPLTLPQFIHVLLLLLLSLPRIIPRRAPQPSFASTCPRRTSRASAIPPAAYLYQATDHLQGLLDNEMLPWQYLQTRNRRSEPRKGKDRGLELGNKMLAHTYHNHPRRTFRGAAWLVIGEGIHSGKETRHSRCCLCNLPQSTLPFTPCEVSICRSLRASSFPPRHCLASVHSHAS